MNQQRANFLGTKMAYDKDAPLHVAMYPWYAMGHITSFLRLGNKLAQRGHKVSFLIPTKAQLRFASRNHYPNLITFIPITVPSVDGLPKGAETTNDVNIGGAPLLGVAMDLTKETVDAHLARLKPNVVFFDFAYWIPDLARKHGAISVYYLTALLVRFAYISPLSRSLPVDYPLSETDYLEPPPSFPNPCIRLQPHEARSMANVAIIEFGEGVTLNERTAIGMRDCDAMGVKSCKEMEKAYCDFVEEKFPIPVLLAGPVVPDHQSSKLEERFDSWLNNFGIGSVVYCAFGSECALQKDQFQELVQGLELTGRPFLAALKPPTGNKTVESALPEGFAERTKGRGIVYGGWVQQQLILQHPSVGCFITHCGAGSLSEAIVSESQIVMIPQAVDQFINAKMMSLELKVGVEVERKADNGFYPREAVQKALELVMAPESEVGREVRANHAKWREFILKEGVEEAYISSFIQSLQQLLE